MRGLWAWGPGVSPAGNGGRGAMSGGARAAQTAASARRLVVCGLLLLMLPGSSTDRQGAAHQRGAPARVGPLAGMRGASSKLPSFVGSWAAAAAPAHAIRQLCRRAPAPVMVSVEPRTGSFGESRPQREGRRTDASAIADGVNASFKSVVLRTGAARRAAAAGGGGARGGSAPDKAKRRRGIGSREPEQPVRGPSVPKTMGDGGTAAAARVGGKQSGATPEEFLNRVAIQRQAARRLLEKADDMTGGARLGVSAAATQQGLYSSEEESITDAVAVARNAVETYEYSEEVESDWEMQKRNVFKPAGTKGRWKSRLRSMRPESEHSSYTPEEASYVFETQRQRDLANRELMRKVTMLTKGRRRGVEAALELAAENEGDRDLEERELFLNPGFIDKRRRENERAATQGGSCSGVPLSELGRRGLVGRSQSAGDLHRGAKSIERELAVAGVVFDMQVLGDRLYSGGSDNCVSIYDTTSWEKIGVLEGHAGWVNVLLLDAGRNLLYTASQDATVKVWDLASKTCVHTLEGHDDGAISLQLVGKRLVVGCSGRMMVWDTGSWSLVSRLTGHTQVLRAMSDGKQMSKNLDIDPRLAIAREAANLAGTKVGGLASSKHYMFSAVDQGSVWVWSKKHLEVERKLLGPRGTPSEPVWVRSLQVLQVPCPKTGKPCEKLLSGWADGALRVFDLATWSLEHTLTAHSGPILSVALVGDKVITTGADMSAAEWDPATWTLSRVLRDHYGAVCAVTALDDGRVLTASLDGKLKVWVAHEAPKSVRGPAAAEAAGAGTTRRSLPLANRRG